MLNKMMYKTFFEVSWLKTIYFNLRYFPIKQAVMLPVFIYKHTDLYETKGKIIIDCSIKTGIVKVGVPECYTLDMKNKRTKWKVNGIVKISGKLIIGNGSVIRVMDKNSLLSFGKNCIISGGTSIICKERIEIGDNSLLSWDILMMDTDYHHIIDTSGTIINQAKPISIGDHVWIGCRCTILKGIEISDNVVIAANSTITSSVSTQNCIIGGHGQSIQVLKENINWKN